MRVLVTGGAGFIGSNFIRYLLDHEPEVKILNLDALTYAGNLESLSDVQADPRYGFVKADITDAQAVQQAFDAFRPETAINFAAESHVDRSILDAGVFVRTNVQGVLALLEAVREFGVERFVQVSTDEVYGSLKLEEPPFTEESPLAPNSPYAASKAAADLLVRSYVKTHSLPAVITRCSNNYGPYQFPEKFIPLFVLNAIKDEPLPLYGDGKNVRDWIHVADHCAGIWAAATRGEPGRVYNLGGGNEWENIEVARLLLTHLEKSEDLIRLVTDRPGHDRRYALSSDRAASELGWSPAQRFEEGIADTVAWYRENAGWCEAVASGEYRDYYEQQYGER